MRLLVTCRLAWLLSVLLALMTSPVAWSAPPSSPATIPATSKPAADALRDPEAFLQQALDLERQRNWQAAIELYEDALQHWPSRAEFSHRRRLCETHYKIVKRYQDQSFRKVLLRLPRERRWRSSMSCSNGSRRSMSIPSRWSRWSAGVSTIWRSRCATPSSSPPMRANPRSSGSPGSATRCGPGEPAWSSTTELRHRRR